MRALLAIAALAGAAHADATFEAKATGAVRIDAVDAAWLLVGACDDAKRDDFEQRECRLVRDGRAAALRGKTLAIDGDPAAFVVGAWSEKTKTSRITLQPCIRCTPVDVAGVAWFLAATGVAPRADTGPALHDGTRALPDETAAARWKAISFRVEWLVELGAATQPRRWNVVGWRVIAACDGSIVIASPPSQPVAGDPKRCTPTPIARTNQGDSEKAALAAMRSVGDAARACFVKLKAAGSAKLKLTIAADGTLASYTREGFGESETGACIDAAVKRVKFPRGSQPVSIGYPIELR
jgi:hypothetical protein